MQAVQRVMTLRSVTVVLAGALLLSSPSPVLACVCIEGKSVEAAIRDAPVIIVARVISIGSGSPGLLEPGDPASVEIEVSSRVKGDPAVTRLRIWNPMAGTSCGGAFASVKPGMDIVVGMRRVSDRRRNMAEFFDAVNFAGRDGDWILEASACLPSIDILVTDRQRERWVAIKR